jgi:hypothetical protein
MYHIDVGLPKYKIAVVLVTNRGSLFKTVVCDLSVLRHQLSSFLCFNLTVSGVKYIYIYIYIYMNRSECKEVLPVLRYGDSLQYTF